MTIEEIEELIDVLIEAAAEFQKSMDFKMGCTFACFQTEKCAKEDLIEAIKDYGDRISKRSYQLGVSDRSHSSSRAIYKEHAG